MLRSCATIYTYSIQRTLYRATECLWIGITDLNLTCGYCTVAYSRNKTMSNECRNSSSTTVVYDSIFVQAQIANYNLHHDNYFTTPIRTTLIGFLPATTAIAPSATAQRGHPGVL